MKRPNTALITGGSRGIGAAAARALAADGWDVAISYRNGQSEAMQVVERCIGLGRRAVAIRADASVETDIARLFAEVRDALGAINALVNNAGIMDPPERVENYTADRLSRLFAINVTGSFLTAAHAVREMSSRHGGAGGVIINVSSRAAQLGAAGENVDYAASKAALDIFTVGLGQEVAAEGIRVVGIRPGLIETDMQPPGRLARIGTTPPLGRPGSADEVAAAIVFLVSDAASYITGTTLDVSGGR